MDEKVRLVAFDPGVVTGWAVLEGDPDESIVPKLVKAGEAMSMIEATLVLAWAVKREDCRTVVIEKFVPTRAPMTTAIIVTCETVGALKWLAARLRVPIILQAPAARTAFRRRVPKAFKLKGRNEKSPHIRDAIAHGWRYYASLRR